MIKYIRISALAAVTALVLGCGPDKSERGQALLAHVPEDSPYLFAVLEPMPEDVWEKHRAALDEVLGAYLEFVDLIFVDSMDKYAARAEGDAAEENDRFQDIYGEIKTILSVEGLRDIGIEPNRESVFYGYGLFPVMRLSIVDGAKLNAFIERIETKAGESMKTADIGGQSYRFADFEEIRIVITVAEDEAVIGLIPAGSSDTTLSEVVGVETPSENLAGSDKVGDLIKSGGFLSHYLAYIDVVEIVDTFVTGQTGVNAQLLEMMEYDTALISDVCRTEALDLARIMPRITMGYTRLDTTRMDMNLIFEVREDLAKAMQSLTAPVPGLGGDMGGAMGFGMSFDVAAAQKFATDRIEALEASPYRCEHFENLNATATGGRVALSQPLPPMVSGLRGFLVLVESFKDIDMMSPTPKVDLRGLVAVENAQGLLLMGQMFSPELANLDIQMDGKPVQLPMGSVPVPVGPVHLAMKEDAIAFSVGEGLDTKLTDMLEADAGSPSPLMTFTYDVEEYGSLMAKALEMAPPSQQMKMSPESFSALMTGISNLYERATINVVFTERGVEMPMSMTMPE